MPIKLTKKSEASASPTQPSPSPAPPAASTPAPAKKGKTRTRLDMAKKYRETHFKSVNADRLWASQHGGWAHVPRAVGLIANVVVKEAAKTKFKAPSAAGTTYQTVWLNWQGEGMALIGNELDAAFESGYGGERGITTFRKHMRTLKDLGFIDFIEERRGRIRWVLVHNPYIVVKKLHDDGHIEDDTYLAVTEKMQAIGATDEVDETEDDDGLE